MAGKGEGPAIGIDLGTTYSCVGVWQHDRVEIIANDQGNRTTPSYVGFTDSERLIGDAAKNQVAMNPINTVFGIYIINLANTILGSTFSKPHLLTLTDPHQLYKEEWQPIYEAALGSIPTIVFFYTDIRMSHDDINIHAINKEKCNISRLLWLLSRTVLQLCNSIPQCREWNGMVDGFFNHEQEKTKEYFFDGSPSIEYGNCGYDIGAVSNGPHNLYFSDNQWGGDMSSTLTFAALPMGTPLGNRSQETGVVSSSNWADLPAHLLDIVLGKLVLFLDYVRFSVVCISWYHIAMDNREKFVKKINRQVPMLLLPGNNEKKGDLKNLFNITTKEFVNIELRIPCNTRYAGSSRGWLIYVEENYTITLINPISPNSVIKLPPILRDKIEVYPFQISRVILSADPTTEPHDYEVAAIYGYNSYIAIIRPGRQDKKWIYPDLEQTDFHDIAYYKGRLYAADYDGCTYCLDDTLSFERALRPSPNHYYCRRSPPLKVYLLESMSRDLLLVLRYFTWERDPGFPSHRTTCFILFKWNPSRLIWVQTKCLGGESLFLGVNMSSSVLATEIPGCSPNSIYYTHDDDQGIVIGESGFVDSGVYNIKESTFAPYFVTDETSLRINMVKQSPIWFVPNFLSIYPFTLIDRD